MSAKSPVAHWGRKNLEMLRNCCVVMLVTILALSIASAQNTDLQSSYLQSNAPDAAKDCSQNPSTCRALGVQDNSLGGAAATYGSPTGTYAAPYPQPTYMDMQSMQPDYTLPIMMQPNLSTPPYPAPSSESPTQYPQRVYNPGTSTVTLPPEPPTEFQQFVETSIGRRLPLFGHSLFQDVPTTFAPLDRVPVPANYVVGPGDELLIRVWGQINVDARAVVDRNGQVYLPKVGAITVAGRSYEQLPDYLKSAVGRVFRNFDLQVTLGHLRSIQVFVVGYARRPGAYTVSSLSTLLNALFASGGPSAHGSLRHIQLKRENRVITDFDLYELLLNGDKSHDAVLLPGDVIYIPPVGPQVALAGSVNFPAIYEMHSSATLGEHLEIAGGLTNVADGEKVIVERIENHTIRKVDEFELNSEGQKRQLQDGDLVRVFSLSPKFENAVTLRGNVAQPGRYPFRASMRVRDLIPNREFLLTRAFWHTQNQAGNAVVTAASAEAPAEPGDSKTKSLNQAELRNDIKRNAPDINWDYAVIQRINPQDLSTSLISFNLGRAILEGNEADNIALQPGDVVTIFSQRDIAVPNEHQTKFVRLEGEFRTPGVYKVRPGETLRSLITRAGGLTDGAFVYGSQFTRERTRQEQQAGLDQMVRDLEVQSQNQTIAVAAAHPEQQQNLQAQMQAQQSFIQKFRELKATGRIVLETKPTQKTEEAFPDIPLEDGDTLVVPNRPSTVNVLGSVYNPNAFVFRENTRILDYVKLSGSGTRDADMKHVYVVRADGSVLSKTNVPGKWSGGLSSVRAVAGDTVVVPTKLDKGATIRALKDWSQILGQFGLAAAAVNVFK